MQIHTHDNSLGYILNIAASVTKNGLFSVLAPSDITPEQYSILSNLTRETGISQRKLAADCYKDEANVTRILKKLHDKGLIEKKSDEKDSRMNLIVLSEAGQEKLDSLEAEIASYREKMFHNLTQEELVELKRILKKMIEPCC